MWPVKILRVTFTALIFTVSAIIAASNCLANDTVYWLDNGMEVILVENHSSPMIASIIFVKSGSKYESEFENDMTHFLEHLLFDGTVNLSRQELDQSIRDLGGYINAFTRKELTAYLVLMPKQYINYGLTVQADMLFNSIFPEDELAKERRVVLEEIKKDMDSPTFAAEEFFTEKAYAGTPYNCPVLGYEAFIENIPRDAIIDYWKRYYTPGNMTVLIIGDFETDRLKNSLQRIFGSIPDSANVPPAADTTLPTMPTPTGAIEGQNVFDTIAGVTSTHINCSFAAPRFSDDDYLAVDLLSQYLGMDDISPLMIDLKGGADPIASEAYVSLNTTAEFSRLEISAITENPANVDRIIQTILGNLKAIPSHLADNEAIDGIKTSVKCQNIYNAEKLHYLGFMIAPMMGSAGWDFIQSYPENLAKVQWSDCRQAAAKWLFEPNYIATIVRPVTDSAQVPYRPGGPSAEQVTAYFDTTRFAQYDLSKGYPLEYEVTDSVTFELEDHARYVSEVLDNGLTVIIKSNPDTRVFAMNIIGKNRTASEPDGKAGITDFVNRCIEKGTLTRNSAELSRDLARIGANVTLYDNPWIPYDDRYTQRPYSFMKFETIDDFAEKGFNLFTEMILYPSFDSTDVENVRNSMLGLLGRNASSPREVALNAFHSTLFEGEAYAKPIMGSPMTVSSITAEELRNYHAMFYSPSNMILSIVTNLPADQVKQWVDNRFGRLSYPPFSSPEAQRPEPFFKTKINHTELEKQQIYLYMGCVLPEVGSPDAAAIDVATTILNNRLYLNLREKQGLAYTVGAASSFDRNFGWFYTVMGTGSENYQTAIDGIILQIDKLSLDGPMTDEVIAARNQLWGSLMRAKLSSINQAYYLGVDNFLGRGLRYDSELIASLARIDIAAVRRVASKYFRTDIYVLASAGKKQ
ncbi:MAG: pitrilysin family protein [Candidatus Zixiibacteriota bacterium]